ncbi:ABC transporter ATP-binding protein [Aquibaculum sediminis]|uniref:ABC transporter ATP-binding protein n=1 Tax=Aquibaculum sediminis TaxID=3231907 RepID=UPI0034532F23
MSPVLQVENLEAFYGRAQVLFGLSFAVARGEVVALIGRNGAGKSTTLKAIMGMLAGTRGRVHFAGQEVTGWPSHRIARLGLGYVPEERRIFPELTVLENLEVGRQPPRDGAPQWTPQRLFELFPNLGEMRERAGGRMSGGEQQMLTIARTLMGNPQAILLDEPSEGLAPVIVEQMGRTIAALKGEGLSVLLSEQNLQFAGALADRACVIESGQLRFEGSMAALRADRAVREAYLGL